MKSVLLPGDLVTVNDNSRRFGTTLTPKQQVVCKDNKAIGRLISGDLAIVIYFRPNGFNRDVLMLTSTGLLGWGYDVEIMKVSK